MKDPQIIELSKFTGPRGVLLFLEKREPDSF